MPKQATEGTTDGTHAAAFNIGQDSEGTIISQSFTTTPGQSYKLEFDSGVFGVPSSTLQLHVEVMGAGSIIDQTVTPPVAGTFDPNLVTFHHYTFRFTATDTTTTLQFTDVGTGNSIADTLVDAVSVVETIPNLLLNGDFEAPPFDTVDAGWTVSGTANIAEATEGATDGVHAAAFNVGQDSEGTILSQSFATIPGQNYELQFDTGVFGVPGSTLQLHVEVFGSGSIIDQTITPPVAGTFDCE